MTRVPARAPPVGQKNPVPGFEVRAGAVRPPLPPPPDTRNLHPPPPRTTRDAHPRPRPAGGGGGGGGVGRRGKTWSRERGFLAAGLSDDGRTFLGVTIGEEAVQALDAATGRPTDGLRLPRHSDFVAMKFPIGIDSMKVGLHGNLFTMTSDTERVVWDV